MRNWLRLLEIFRSLIVTKEFILHVYTNRKGTYSYIEREAVLTCIIFDLMYINVVKFLKLLYAFISVSEHWYIGHRTV